MLQIHTKSTPPLWCTGCISCSLMAVVLLWHKGILQWNTSQIYVGLLGCFSTVKIPNKAKSWNALSPCSPAMRWGRGRVLATQGHTAGRATRGLARRVPRVSHRQDAGGHLRSRNVPEIVLAHGGPQGFGTSPAPVRLWTSPGLRQCPALGF